jgi:hypothetical protein
MTDEQPGSGTAPLSLSCHLSATYGHVGIKTYGQGNVGPASIADMLYLRLEGAEQNYITISDHPAGLRALLVRMLAAVDQAIEGRREGRNLDAGEEE